MDRVVPESESAQPAERRSHPRVATSPDHPDSRLRGRRYAIPFDRVWNGALKLADGGLRGWKLVDADDGRGVVRAEATTLICRFVDDVEIRIELDDEAQTVVHLRSASRVGRYDLGTNGRRIRRFLKRLDREVEAGPGTLFLPG